MAPGIRARRSPPCAEQNTNDPSAYRLDNAAVRPEYFNNEARLVDSLDRAPTHGYGPGILPSPASSQGV